MAREHQHLRQCLAGGLVNGHRATWHHTLALTHAVAANRSPESEAVLRDVALFEGKLVLDPAPGLPHAMSPEDMLRSLALQVLWEWNPKQHRDVLKQLARHARNDAVAAMARDRLK